MLAIDRHAWTNRWSDRHPLEKLVPAGGMLLAALVLPPWPAAPLIIAVMLARTIAGARVPPRAALIRISTTSLLRRRRVGMTLASR